MCTQKRYVENKEDDRSRHGNRHHGGICVVSSNNSNNTESKLGSHHSKYLKSTIQKFNILFYNSIACLAVSASAQTQSTNSGYDAFPSPRPEVTPVQSWPVIYDKSTNIPLLAVRQVSTENVNTNTGVTSAIAPPLTTSRTSLAKTELVRNSKSKDDGKNAESKTTVVNENGADKETLYFILKTFHRYSEYDFLLKTDLEKLLANIGLTSALNLNLNNSEIRLTHNSGAHGNHSYDHKNGHYYHHKQKNTEHQDKHTENINDHSSSFMLNNQSVSATFANVQEKVCDNQRAQSVDVTSTTPATSRIRRQKRKVSAHHHEEHNKCLSTQELLQLFQYEQLDRLNAEHFWHMCPALIDQLDAGFCKQEPPVTEDMDPNASGTGDYEHDEVGHDGSEHDHQHTDSHSHEHNHEHTDSHSHEHDHGNTSRTDILEQADMHPVTSAVWFYAILSVMVISLCSVAGVVVIPNMKRVFYNHILQFLVALAVGAMSGDAMLHLLPHAMLSDSHDDHHHHHGVNHTDDTHSHQHQHAGSADGDMSSHLVGLYKGLVALLGIYSFFFLERLFTLFTRNRSGKSERKQKRRRHCSGGGHEQKGKAFHMVISKLETDGGNAPSCDEMVMIVHPNRALRAYADVSHEAYLHRCDESQVHSPPSQTVVSVTADRDHHAIKEDSSTMEGFTNLGVSAWSGDQLPAAISDAEIIGIIKDTEPVASTHSHSHSHLAPDFVGPLSSVAMMIIVGDMIHNFCDGLAIGAAYAGSIAGGLSTSVAVFCHELPHEIGDFAVLVRSGLTLRKAVYFNLVSSIPCFLGCIIGLAVGNLSSTSSWIFASVGGMFLYVTLVDLIPEMSSVYTKSGEPWFLHLLLQACGIAVGTTIMLIISVSEESLLATFH